MPPAFTTPPWMETTWIASTVFIGGGLLVGWLLELLVVNRLRKIADDTAWKWDDMVFRSLRGMPTAWCMLVGLYLATLSANLEPNQRALTDKALSSFITLTITILLARFLGGAVSLGSGRTGSRAQTTTLLRNGVQIVVYIIGVVVILQNLDVAITPLVTTLGLGGLAVALALQDTLGNLFSGVQIIVSRQVRPGDYILLDSGEQGYVTDIKGRNTTIRSYPDLNQVVIPNSRLASSIVTNYSLPRRRMWISIPVGVSYASDLDRVETVTLEVARQVLAEVEGGLPEEAPVLRYKAFGDSSINFNIRMFVKEFSDQFVIVHEFIKRLHKRYNAEGIEIPFPIRTVHFKNMDPKTE